MAKQNPGEPLDPAFIYTDKKIKPIKAKLNQQQVEILRTQMFLADFMVARYAQTYHNLIDQSHFIKKLDVLNRLIESTTNTRFSIRKSKDPMPIAVKFNASWNSYLKKLGIMPSKF